MRGSCKSDAAISHLMRCPSDNWRVGVPIILLRSSRSTSSSMLRLKRALSTSYMSRNSSNESITGTSHHSWERWPNTTPMLRAWRIRSRHGVRPSITHSPASGVSMPLITLIVDDLPAPFGPI